MGNSTSSCTIAKGGSTATNIKSKNLNPTNDRHGQQPKDPKDLCETVKSPIKAAGVSVDAAVSFDNIEAPEDDSSLGSASDVETDDEEDLDMEVERAFALAIAAQQKEVARWYLHPEDPVVSSGGGRCYFDRASAPEQLDKDEADAMAEALADAEALKERAQWHGSKRHLPVTTNGNAGRSYFDRASAPEQLEKDEADAIADALADAEALKERAQWHCHPSSPLVVDSMCKARNYFDGKDTSEVSSRRVRGESKMDQFDFEVEGIDIDTANDQALMKSALVRSALGAVRHQEDDSAATGTPEKEGNLSRSPSSVMLFDSPVA